MGTGFRSRVVKGFMAAAMLVSQVILPAQVAFAATGGQPIYEVPTDGKISVCHRTNSATSPYTLISVSTSAADGIAGNSGNEADHYGEHKGSIASSEAVANELKDDKIDWGDIIPAIPGVHSGQNWTAIGQAMLRNGCNYVASDAAAGVNVTPPTCDTNGIASVAGLANATLVGSLDQSVGTHTATFNATTGHAFADGTSTLTVEYTILAKLTGRQCENPPTTVTPNVAVVDSCETDDDSVTGVATTGITYKVAQNGLTYTVVASPLDSTYVLADGNGFELNQDGTATLTVILTDVECETPDTEVTPAAPTRSDVCELENDKYIIPTTTGVDYYVGGAKQVAGEYGTAGASSVTVTAIAHDGYALSGQATWTLEFTNEDCLANICTVTDNLFDSEWQYDGETYPSAGGQGTFNFEPTGLYLNTPAVESYVYGLVSAGNTPIGDVDAMSYNALRLPQSAGYASTLPAYLLYVDINGLSVSGGEKYFFYEPYNNDTDRAAVEGTFQLWDALEGGNAKWWMSGTGQALQTWNYFVNEYEDAVVVAYGFNQGTYNAETFSAVQDITFDCATTSFTNEDEGGSGGGGEEPEVPVTPVTPTTPVVPSTPVVPAGGQGSVLPAELPLTGTNGSILSTWIALLVAVLTYGAVYYLQPKKRFEQ